MTLTDTLQPLLEATGQQGFAEIDGLRLTVYPSGVLHIDRHKGELGRDDVDAVRAAFAGLGYDELESWLPRQGVSWLSDGVSAGVSFRLQKRKAVCGATIYRNGVTLSDPGPCGWSLREDGTCPNATSHIDTNNPSEF